MGLGRVPGVAHRAGASPVDQFAERGRGLVLVEALAAEWGSHPDPDHTGKVVWVCLDLTPQEVNPFDSLVAEVARLAVLYPVGNCAELEATEAEQVDLADNPLITGTVPP